VTVAIAHELGARLGAPVELICVDAARKSFAALSEGRVDVTFLAIEPTREGEVAFSPYLTIERLRSGTQRRGARHRQTWT
jgi:polar amino acid transport system substrate-binding protein